MKVYDIKWDVTDGTEEMTPEKIEETLAMLPKEIELPEEVNSMRMHGWMKYQIGYLMSMDSATMVSK